MIVDDREKDRGNSLDHISAFKVKGFYMRLVRQLVFIFYPLAESERRLSPVFYLVLPAKWF